MKKRNIFLVSLMIIIIAVFGGYLLNDYMNNKSNTKPTMGINQIRDTQGISNKVILEDTIIKSIKGETKLVTMEVNVNEEIIYDDSYSNYSLSKQKQKLNFFADGIFTTDLSGFSAENIIIDDDKKTVTIKVKEPILDYINFLPEDTTYEEVEKGLFRFGDIKLSMDELNEIEIRAKESIKTKLSTKEMEEKSIEATIKAVEEIFLPIIESGYYDDYTLIIEIIDQ